MAKADRIFTNRPRKIFRKHIPTTEMLFGIGFVIFTIAMGVWFAAKRDAYDPTERDISFELLAANTVQDTLYKAPLKRWQDPSAAPTAGGAPSLGIFPDGILQDGWEAATRILGAISKPVYVQA